MWRANDTESSAKFIVFEVYIKHFSKNLRTLFPSPLEMEERPGEEFTMAVEIKTNKKLPKSALCVGIPVMPGLGATIVRTCYIYVNGFL